uniref:Lipid-binding serum glycoprotein N-terminal domain-containing protein n=1 Tax=Graphocephala atropunctata TaxID=36148 RepID=A0A1B6MHC3_9HEMI
MLLTFICEMMMIKLALSSALPLTYTEEINDITDLILERTLQIVRSHHQEVIPIQDLDITFKPGISKPSGTIEARDGGFRGLDSIEREGDAFLIRTDENDMKLVALMRMSTMSYFYNSYSVNVNNTAQSGSLNVVIKENLVKMDLHLTTAEECAFQLTDLNIKIANNYTVQMSLMEVQPLFYQELINWACETYLTVITDTVREALFNNINQALHDLEICHFIMSPNGLADLLPKKRLDLPFFSFNLN